VGTVGAMASVELEWEVPVEVRSRFGSGYTTGTLTFDPTDPYAVTVHVTTVSRTTIDWVLNRDDLTAVVAGTVDEVGEGLVRMWIEDGDLVIDLTDHVRTIQLVMPTEPVAELVETVAKIVNRRVVDALVDEELDQLLR